MPSFTTPLNWQILYEEKQLGEDWGGNWTKYRFLTKKQGRGGFHDFFKRFLRDLRKSHPPKMAKSVYFSSTFGKIYPLKPPILET